jgi:hypothetical protein
MMVLTPTKPACNISANVIVSCTSDHVTEESNIHVKRNNPVEVYILQLTVSPSGRKKWKWHAVNYLQGRVHPITYHEGTEREKYSSTHSLTWC